MPSSCRGMPIESLLLVRLLNDLQHLFDSLANLSCMNVRINESQGRIRSSLRDQTRNCVGAVRQAGVPPGLPCNLETRITGEQIANYFEEGWGMTEIERDLNLLTRAEIEGAVYDRYIEDRTRSAMKPANGPMSASILALSSAAR
jgi:uncharacterized protein (DUF433 family)